MNFAAPPHDEEGLPRRFEDTEKLDVIARVGAPVAVGKLSERRENGGIGERWRATIFQRKQAK